MADLERSPGSGSPERLVEMGRLKNLSDGVFAIALTLLVLDIRIPEDALMGDLPTKLIELVPKAPDLPDQLRGYRWSLGFPPKDDRPDQAR